MPRLFLCRIAFAFIFYVFYNKNRTLQCCNLQQYPHHGHRQGVVFVLGVGSSGLRLQSVGNEKRTAEQGEIRQNKNRVRPPRRTLPRSTDDNDMYNRALPDGNALFFFAGFIGVRGNVCGLFLFVQTHTPLTIRRQLNVIVPDTSFLYESRKFYLLRHHSRHCD